MKLKLLSILFVAASLLLAGCDQPSGQSANTSEIMLRANSYFQQGQFSAASIEARNTLKVDPENIEANLLTARIYFEQGNYQQATKILLTMPPTNVQVVELLGNVYLKQGKLKSLRKMLEDADNNQLLAISWELQYLRAIEFVHRNPDQQAYSEITKLSESAKTPNEKSMAELVRAAYFSKLSNKAMQTKALDKALELAPEFSDALIEKARFEFDEKNYEAAEDLLSQVLLVLPRTDVMTLKRLEVMQAMASTMSRLNRSGEAMIYSKLIAEANPQAQELQNEFEQGIEKLRSGDTKAAEDALSKLYLATHARAAGSVLGMIKFHQGDYKGAADLFQDTIDPETASPQVLRAFAESQLRLRNPELALKVIESNIQDKPDDLDVLSIYGLALLASGNTSKGIEILNQILAKDNKRYNTQLALAAAYNVKNQPEKALQQLEAAYAANKTAVNIQERLATQYDLMGKSTELGRLANELAESTLLESQVLGGIIQLKTDTKAGIKLLDKLYVNSPYDIGVLRAQLRKSMYVGDTAQIINIGKQLIAQDNNDIGTLGAITQAYIRQNQSQKGLAYLRELSNQSANAWGPDYIMAGLSYVNNDFKQAAILVSQATAKSAYNVATSRLYNTIYQHYAASLASNKEYSLARDVLLEAIQNNEPTPALQHLLIRVEIADNNLAEAAKLVKELELSAPNKSATLHAQGDLAAAENRPRDALAIYQQAWKMQATDALAVDIWKLTLSESQQRQESFLTDWLKQLPNSIAAKNISGIRKQEKGDSEGAIKDYNASLAISMNQPVILNNLAWLLMESNRIDEAYKTAENAVSLAGNIPSILDTFGWIAFKAGKKEIALEYLEKALSLEPDNTEIKEHLAQVKK